MTQLKSRVPQLRPDTAKSINVKKKNPLKQTPGHQAIHHPLLLPTCCVSVHWLCPGFCPFSENHPLCPPLPPPDPSPELCISSLSPHTSPLSCFCSAAHIPQVQAQQAVPSLLTSIRGSLLPPQGHTVHHQPACPFQLCPLFSSSEAPPIPPEPSLPGWGRHVALAPGSPQEQHQSPDWRSHAGPQRQLSGRGGSQSEEPRPPYPPLPLLAWRPTEEAMKSARRTQERSGK